MAVVDVVSMLAPLVNAFNRDSRNLRIRYDVYDDSGQKINGGTWGLHSVTRTERELIVRTGTVTTPSTGSIIRVWVQVDFAFGGYMDALYIGEYKLGVEIPAGDTGTLEFHIVPEQSQESQSTSE